MATDTRKLVLGAVALAVGSVLIFAVGVFDAPLPAGPVAAVAALVMAAGALLVGLSERGAGV